MFGRVKTTRSPGVSRQRELGAYYSPEPYARALVEWATANERASLLDPSFGGCAVLRVAIDHLTKTNPHATKFIYGADIDRETALWAAHLTSQGVPAKNLRQGDFLSLSPNIDFPMVDAVVGNPPYIRHHNINPTTRRNAKRAIAAAGASINGRASLWAYFVVHSAAFVKPGGRLALILPGALLQAGYSSEVLSHLSTEFAQITLVRVRERIFTDAEEETVILLAEKSASNTQSGNSKTITLTEAADLSELRHHLSSMKSGHPIGQQFQIQNSEISPWKMAALPAECWNLFAQLTDSPHIAPLGSIATIRIGTVTGANRFFLLDSETVANLRLQEFVTPALTRSREVNTYEASFDYRGNDSWLLSLPADFALDRRSRIGRRIREGEIAGYPDRHQCRRTPWWALGRVHTPDAFLPYMMGDPKGLSINRQNLASTNAIHHVDWLYKPNAGAQKLAALTTWSSLGALASELYGRHYGGGVLKLEPSDAKLLPVLVSSYARNALQRALATQAPNEIANIAVRRALDIEATDIHLLASGARILASLRKPPPKIPADPVLATKSS